MQVGHLYSSMGCVGVLADGFIKEMGIFFCVDKDYNTSFSKDNVNYLQRKDMSGKLKNKIAVVTGSTSGIGATIARAFAQEGAQVVITGRRADRGESVVTEIVNAGGQAVFEQADMADAKDCKRVCTRANEAFGGLDTLVNNAGIFPRAKFEETTPEFWDHMFAVNTRSAFLCSQAAVPMMRARGGGSIVNMGSTLPWSLGDNLFAYGCSKGAMYTMTRQLAGILRKDRIRVNWVTIGWVLTEKEFEVQAGEGRAPGWEVEQADHLPMGAFNTEQDMADACVYLASDAAARVTGTDLNVSAGLNIHM